MSIPRILELRQEKMELLQELAFLEEDRKQYYQIKRMLKQKGSKKKVTDITNLNINPIENRIQECRERIRIIENGPYINGRIDKTQSYNELMKYARKKALKQIMKM